MFVVKRTLLCTVCYIGTADVVNTSTLDSGRILSSRVNSFCWSAFAKNIPYIKDEYGIHGMEAR